MYYVYVLENEGGGTYTGYTQDLARRWLGERIACSMEEALNGIC